MVKNPFTPQYPISPELFYGRDESIDRFKYNVDQSMKGSLTNMAFFGKFGIGKTSLLRKLESLDICKNIPKVYITLKDTYASSFEDVIGYIYDSLRPGIKKFVDSHNIEIDISYLKLESKEKFSKDYFREYMTKLWNDLGRKTNLIIVFIDDFYLVYEYSMDIRNCFQELQHKNCRYMLVITTLPETLKFGRREDPVKRFFDWNEVKEFSKKETSNMINHIIKESKLDISFSSEVLEDIHSITLGHPYYIFIILNEILRHKDSGRITKTYYHKILPKITDRMNITFKKYYSDLSWKEEEALKNIVNSGLEVFSPSGVSSATNTLQSLADKDVIVKIRYGEYKFKHPLVQLYFSENYSEGE